MGYRLILEEGERKAFDLVGNRYSSTSRLIREGMGPDDEWSQEGPITFNIPEYVAWQIRDHAEGDGFGWPCFGTNLCAKMTAFVDSII